MNSREPGCLSNKEFIELLSREVKCGDTYYTRVNNNYPYIGQEQLSQLATSMILKVGAYLNNPTIEDHFWNDVIQDLTEVYESEVYQDEQ